MMAWRILIPRGSRLIGRYSRPISKPGANTAAMVAWEPASSCPTIKVWRLAAYGGDAIGRGGYSLGRVNKRFGENASGLQR